MLSKCNNYYYYVIIYYYFKIDNLFLNISFLNFDKKYTMQEASFNGLVKTIIYLIGFYYLVKFLAKLFAPIILKGIVNKVQENFDKQQTQGSYQKQEDSYVRTSKKENPKSTKKVGEYIDYEEID
jgi:uncharacterized membrane-anchored protein YitT (DUF2179 family)